MKKLFDDAKLEEARSCASPIKKTSRAEIDRSISGSRNTLLFYVQTHSSALIR
jgi:hypothetical protein